MARDFDRQVAEFQVGVIVLNGFTALGILVAKIQDRSVRENRKSDRQLIYAAEPVKVDSALGLLSFTHRPDD